jgi:predicted nuclease of predicted toxin-antitoxin system
LRCRFLLDQMLDEDVARELRRLGHDVAKVSGIGLASASDDVILARAIQENRVTLDEHFGDWAILPLSAHPGVIRLKANPTTSNTVLSLLLPFLERAADRDFRNRLVIVKFKVFAGFGRDMAAVGEVESAGLARPYASRSLCTFPCTSVSRKCLPWNLYVSLV